MPKIKIESSIYNRAKNVAEIAGYSSVDEFVLHIIEKELDLLESADDADEEKVKDRLRGLGYIE